MFLICIAIYGLRFRYGFGYTSPNDSICRNPKKKKNVEETIYFAMIAPKLTLITSHFRHVITLRPKYVMPEKECLYIEKVLFRHLFLKHFFGVFLFFISFILILIAILIISLNLLGTQHFN